VGGVVAGVGVERVAGRGEPVGVEGCEEAGGSGVEAQTAGGFAVGEAVGAEGVAREVDGRTGWEGDGDDGPAAAAEPVDWAGEFLDVDCLGGHFDGGVECEERDGFVGLLRAKRRLCLICRDEMMFLSCGEEMIVEKKCSCGSVQPEMCWTDQQALGA
jgi:hypothetical protein